MDPQDIRKKIDEKRQALEEILKGAVDEEGEKRDLTDDEASKFDSLEDEVKELREELEKAEKAEKRFKLVEDLGKESRAGQGRQSRDGGFGEPGEVRAGAEIERAEEKRDTIPATVRRQRARNFEKAGVESRDESMLKAYRFGRVLAAQMGHRSSQQWLDDHRELRVHTEGSNLSGGYLVPDEFVPELINLQEDFGVIRGLLRNVTMSSDVQEWPRLASSVSVAWTGEGDAHTESTAGFDNVKLVAKKLSGITRWSDEIGEDALVDLGDTLMGEFARRLAEAEDDAGFNGDGGSGYGGIVGFKNALGTAGTITAASGSDTDWSNIAMASFTEAVSTIPQYADDGDAVWVVNRAFAAQVMLDLAIDLGGNTEQNARSAGLPQTFLGYPVVIAQKLPNSASTAEFVAYFGNFRQAGYFGERGSRVTGMTNQASVGGQSTFERDQVAMKIKERIDISIHEVGDDTDAGSVVGIKTAS